MTEYLFVALPIGALAVGYWLGRIHMHNIMADAIEAALDRQNRIEPPQRTPGQPTNMASEPSRVTQPRIRKSHFNL
jgi:hypothetical protein